MGRFRAQAEEMCSNDGPCPSSIEEALDSAYATGVAEGRAAWAPVVRAAVAWQQDEGEGDTTDNALYRAVRALPPEHRPGGKS